MSTVLAILNTHDSMTINAPELRYLEWVQPLPKYTKMKKALDGTWSIELEGEAVRLQVTRNGEVMNDVDVLHPVGQNAIKLAVILGNSYLEPTHDGRRTFTLVASRGARMQGSLEGYHETMPEVTVSARFRSGGPVIDVKSVRVGWTSPRAAFPQRMYTSHAVVAHRFVNTLGPVLLHSYVRQFGHVEVIEIDMRVSNSIGTFDDSKVVGSAGDVWMRAFNIYVPQEWAIIDKDGLLGQDSIANGLPGEELLIPRTGYVLRLVLFKKADIEAARFAANLANMQQFAWPVRGSTWSSTPAKGPERSKAINLSDFDFAGMDHRFASDVSVLREAAIAGGVSWTADFGGMFGHQGILGADPSVGGVGGTGIGMHAGHLHGASSNELLLLRMRHDFAMEGSDVLMFTPGGAHLDIASLLAQKNLPRPFDYDLQGTTHVPGFDRQVGKPWNQPEGALPSWALDLAQATRAPDGQHLVRLFINALGLVYLTGDLVAMDDVQSMANHARLAWLEMPEAQDAYWMTGHTLAQKVAGYRQGVVQGGTLVKGARDEPNNGQRLMGREWAHVAKLAAFAYDIDERFRSRLLRWCEMNLEFAMLSPAPGSGIPQRGEYLDFFSNRLPWENGTYNWDKGTAVAATRELPMIAHATAALTSVLYGEVPKGRLAWIVRLADSLLFHAKQKADSWGGDMMGPPIYVGMGQAGGAAFNEVLGYPIGEGCDPINQWELASLAYRLSGDRKYLDITKTYGRPMPALPLAAAAKVLISTTDLSWSSSFIAEALERARAAP